MYYILCNRIFLFVTENRLPIPAKPLRKLSPVFINSKIKATEVRLKSDNAVFNPLSSRGTTFFDLPLKLRIWLLYKLCCWRLDDEQTVTDAIDIKVCKSI